MNQEIFHNQLALSLGYKRILQNKQIRITIDDFAIPDDPRITLDVLDGKLKLTYNASQNTEDVATIILPEQNKLMKDHTIEDEIKVIIDATHQAYIKATRNPF
jgi:hypothetical protein